MSSAVVRVPEKPNGASVPLLARLEAAGAVLTQSGVSSISISSYDAGTLVSGPTSVATSTVIAVTKTDEWDKDATGYNWRYVPAPGTFYPTAGKTYRIVVTYTLTSGEVIILLWDIPVISATGA